MKWIHLYYKNQARIQEKENQTRIARRKESGMKSRKKESGMKSRKKKNQTRIQEHKKSTRILPRQPRFGLHESCQKVKTCFFRQETSIEGMEKRILPDNQEKQESGKNEVKIVD